MQKYIEARNLCKNNLYLSFSLKWTISIINYFSRIFPLAMSIPTITFIILTLFGLFNNAFTVRVVLSSIILVMVIIEKIFVALGGLIVLTQNQCDQLDKSSNEIS